MDELDAIARLKNGDVAGLEPLVRAHQVRALKAAYLVTGDSWLAEEIVQEAFLRLVRSIATFDTTRPFEPWFLRTVVNASVRRMEQYRRLVPLYDDGALKLMDRIAQAADSPESQVESAELRTRVQNALERLSPRQRAVIVQRYFLDMSEAEMARASGSATGTIKWLLHEARRRLRGVLSERSAE
jgi:RNA polymerase sigma-70 factor (ECF subfamily)